MSRRFVALVATISSCFTSPLLCTAQSYTFRRIVDQTGEYSELASKPAINNNGTVVFGGAKPGMQGIFAVTGAGAVSPIALVGGSYAGFSSIAGIDVGTPDINDFGRVAFFAFDAAGSGIYSSDGNSTTTIIHSSTLEIHPNHLRERYSINNAGTVAFFINQFSSQRGVHVGNGGAPTLVDARGSNPTVNNAGTVAFEVSPGIETSGSKKIDPLGTFPSINNSDVVAFKRDDGIYKGSGVPIGSPQTPDVSLVVAETNQIIDPGLEGRLAINNRGNVAFWHAFDPGGAIHTMTAGRVIGSGDELLGGTVDLVDFSPHGFNDQNQIVFFAQYTTPTADGPVTSRGIFIADPINLPGDPTLPGDFNLDGSVDAADYVVWRDGLGTVFTQVDYDIWRAHFGQTAANSPVAHSSVPEPAMLTLLLLAAICQCIRRRCGPT
jgi:hypothetical protein